MNYKEKKRKLINDYRALARDKLETVSLSKPTSNLFRAVECKQNTARIDVREFNQVVNIDKDNLVVEVEGMMTYEALVRETLKHGLLPAVVPQLKSITIGGAYAGGGIESSSFRYGLVHETISEAEVLLADGSVVVAAAHNEYGDLFRAFPNTYGALGYALKVKAKLVPAKKFVKLTYLRYADSAAYFQKMAELCQANRADGQIAFIDGVIFSDTEMYIATGEFVDSAPYTSDYTYMQVFYQSIRARQEDYLTTEDYIWRWDADWFWCSKVFFMQNPIIRAIAGKFMLKSTVYAKLMRMSETNPLMRGCSHLFSKGQESIIQDILIPATEAQAFFRFFEANISIKPVWICPAYAGASGINYDFCPMEPGTFYLDFGFWDKVASDRADGYYNRLIEQKTAQLKGFKSLYSTSYYSEDEFWQLYDQSLYERLKSKYDPDNSFKSFYREVVSDGQSKRR